MTVIWICKRLSHVALESFDKYPGIIIMKMELSYGRHVPVFSFWFFLFFFAFFLVFRTSMLISIATGLVYTPSRSGQGSPFVFLPAFVVICFLNNFNSRR